MKVEATDLLATDISGAWARLGCDSQEEEKMRSDCPPQTTQPPSSGPDKVGELPAEAGKGVVKGY